MKKITLRQIVNVLALIATLIVNTLANALPLNNISTGDISDMFEVYFVPAGYVFSIWGVIYLALTAFIVYQALPAQRENPNLQRIGYWFLLSCLANMAWLFTWHYLRFPLSMVVMLILLATLIVIYLKLNIGRTKFSGAEKWCVQIPFSIYLGWITVATIANATSLLDHLGWNGWGITPEIWTVIMLLVATVVAWLMAILRRDVAYLLVLVWAFAGIAVKHVGTPLVANSAWAATALVAIAAVTAFYLKSRTETAPA